jgi:hypothetical protein
MNCPTCGSDDIEMDLSFRSAVYPVSYSDGELTIDFKDAPTVDDLVCNKCGWMPERQDIDVVVL